MACFQTVLLVIVYQTLTTVVVGYYLGSQPPQQNCTGPNCRTPRRPVIDQEQMRKIRIQMIKEQILSKLRMQARPNVTKAIPRVAFHKALEKLRRRDPKLRKGKNADYYAQISEIVSFSEEAPHQNHNALQFTFSRDELMHEDLDVTSAHLWILLRYKKPKHVKRKPRHVVIGLHKLTKEGDKGETISSFPVGLKHSRWQKLIVPVDVIQRMFEEETVQLRFLISCDGCDTEVEPVLVKKRTRQTRSRPRSRQFRRRRRKRLNKRRPFLIIRTHVKPAAKHKIEKRALRCDSEYNGCCKRSLFVNFKEMGWDWIIAPTGYNAHYCSGVCGLPNSPDLYASRHSSLLANIFSKNQHRRLEPCCSPYSMTSLSLLYYDDKNDIVKADLDDMVVEHCACS